MADDDRQGSLKLDVLPPAQRRLWDELGSVPAHLVLYGGTAIALRLGHRESIDFDFFTERHFLPDELFDEIPLLAGGTVLQTSPDTLALLVRRGDPVKLSFFGGLEFGRVGEPRRDPGFPVWIASLRDLFGHKLETILQRVELKDYRDVVAFLRSGFELADGLQAALGLFGYRFAPLECI